MVLLKNPAYRAVLEGYLALNQQSSTRLEEQALSAPLNKFPFLYRLWANLKVLNVLLHVCTDLGYRCVSHHWVKSFRNGAFVQVINDGQIAVQLHNPTTGTQVNVIPLKPLNDTQNISNLEGPMALAIAIDAPQKPLVILVFDPRYQVGLKKSATKAASKKALAKTLVNILPPRNQLKKLTRSTEPTKEDIDELAQCIEQLNASVGEQEVQYAALLYPGQGLQIAPGIEAIAAHPSNDVAFQKNIYGVLRRYLA